MPSHPLRLLVIATFGTALLVPGVTAPAHGAAADPFPDVIALPDGFLPEGIAIGAGPTAWFGSRAD